MPQRPPFREPTPAQLRARANQWRIEALAITGAEKAKVLRRAELYEELAANVGTPFLPVELCEGGPTVRTAFR